MTAVRDLATGAPKDGTTITAFHFGLIGQSRLTPDKVPIDFRKFAWIGSISQDLSICYTWHVLGIKNLAELKVRKNLHFGLTGIGTNDDIYARILKWIFGVDLHQVSGYPPAPMSGSQLNAGSWTATAVRGAASLRTGFAISR